ncbi:hypothetical protein ACEPAH_2514 [Sanghuangporus vaninii]
MLRFQRVDALRRKSGDSPPVNINASDKKDQLVAGRSDVKLTPEETLLRVAQIEMPGLMRFSLVFALFKAYSTTTVSEILLQSKQLSTPKNVSGDHWTKLHGWRGFLPIEREFVLWKEIGRWVNIPETLQDLIEWTESYEETAMVPTISNYKVDHYTLDDMLSPVTEWLGVRKFMRQFLCARWNSRQIRFGILMIFIRLPAPSPVMDRYFELPRFKRKEFIRRKSPEEKFKEKMPRFHPAVFDEVPWYRPEPKGISRRRQNLLVKIGYLDNMYIPSPKYKSEGYRLEECSPISLEQDGHAEWRR